MKKEKKLRKKKYHYDYNSFFIDDVLNEVKSRHKRKTKKFGLTS